MPLSEIVALTPAQIAGICFYPRGPDGQLRPPRLPLERPAAAAPTLAGDLARLAAFRGQISHQRYAQLVEQLLDKFNVPAEAREEYRHVT